MDICHSHNRRAGLRAGPKTFGLRLSLPEGDTMSSVLGDGWHTFEWFRSDEERARRIAELTAQFTYYRKGDRPTYVIEKVDRDAADATGPRRESHG
jgi:hypothetical protein